tara:strand:- start:147 stop:908 length:762 start_codon:yes stop_codon:yes gene_type:complete
MGGSLTSPNKIKDVYKKIVFYDDNKFKVDNGTEDVIVSTETTLSEIDTSNFADTALVLESEGLNSSDNDTSLPTTAAVKDYVDSQVTAQDLDFQADTGGALSIDLDSESLTVSGGTGVATTGSGNAITVNTVDSEIDHDSLNNYDSDEHVAHSFVTLTAGAGLTGGGNITTSREFAVGAGTGITVNANDVAVDTSVIATKNYVDGQVSTVNTLGEMTDVTLSSLGNGDVLQYSTSTSEWNNTNEIDGGPFTGS